MIHRILCALALILAAVAVPNVARADHILRCESIDFRDGYCQADTRGGVHLIRELSDTSCVIGRNWGYDHGGIWVTNGCSAEFGLGTRGETYGYGYGYNRGGVVVCESRDYARTRCDIDARAGVSLINQLSRSDCVEGRTWGYDSNGIWVDDGCAGEFRVDPTRVVEREVIVTQPRRVVADTTVIEPRVILGGDTIVCESRDYGREECSMNLRGRSVELVRRISDTPCERGSNWGFTRNGVWVAGGCGAEFRVVPELTASYGSMVRCESVDNARSICETPRNRAARIVRQLSDSPCIKGQTWGRTRHSIWVDDGCRAEFEIVR